MGIYFLNQFDVKWVGRVEACEPMFMILGQESYFLAFRFAINLHGCLPFRGLEKKFWKIHGWASGRHGDQVMKPHL